ncbi:SWIM zinc finger family protein [Actinophytocola glycyrrhizae]|uniref:SWIM zinc finger domain-containing protein n=1 Tax=Actinophytocola glycyrrhizae TaxID=2044873 RepID=A0ABV9S6X1_9PSEU
MLWFTEDDLRAAAGDGSFRRGREYVDAVGELQPTALGVRAAVRGKDVYEVWLGREHDALAGECGCPFGIEGNFCKHCVAVGLVLLADGAPGPDADLGAYLRSLDQRELVELVLAQAQRDPGLYRQLALRAGSTGAPQVAVLRRQLDTALRVRGFSDGDYATRAKDVIDTVRALVDAGHAAEARPLARHAVELLVEAMGAVDDPADAVAGVCRRAVKLYARACAVARPNPAKLAGWLFQLRRDWPTWPTIDIGDFAEPLGEAGMAAYRALVDEAWHALDDDEDHTVLRAMREQLARTSGDVDTMVDVLADGLPSVRAYREIVSVLRHAGRLGEAIRWAERGVAETRDLSLTELLVESYLDGQRGDDAVELRKAELRSARTRVCYGRLRETAVAAKVWSGLRPWALDVLPPDELVGALLDDGDVEEAWLAAVKHDCAGVEVVRLRAETHPAEVLAAYRALVTECLSRGGRECYREAGVLLKELAACAQRCGESVSGFVASLRTAHVRRPALLDELRRAGF